MLKKITLKKVLLFLGAVLLIIQLIRIDKTNPPLNTATDISTVAQAPTEITSLLRSSCYDCHSNEVKYPWYTNVAPISWWIKDHINEAREELNFSEWGSYKTKRIDKKLKECSEMIEEGEMPLSSYTLIHGDAKLSKEQQAQLIAWFNSLRTFESDKPKEED